MRVKIILLTTVVAVGAATGVAYATFQSRYVLNEHKAARFVSLTESARTLAMLRDGSKNLVTVALGADLFQNLGSALEGGSVTFTHPSLPGETLNATIKTLHLKPEPGEMTADLLLEVASDKRSVKIDLEVDAVLYFSGIRKVQAATAEKPAIFAADFKLLPRIIEPKVSIGFVNVPARGFVSDIITGNVISAFAQKLTLSAPYQPEFKYTLDENKVFTQHFGDGEKGTLSLKVSHQPRTVDRWIHVYGPVFSDRGVILAGALDENAAAPFSTEEPSGDVPDEKVSKLENQIAGQVKEVEKFFSPKHVTVSLSSNAMSSLTSGITKTFQGLSLDIASTQIDGRFVDKKWRDRILGDGGFYVEAAGGDRVHGTITLPSVVLNYKPGQGLTGSVTLDASADADLHVHVDPLIGGGVGTTIKLKGATNTTLAAKISTSTFHFENEDFALLAPVLTCTAVEVTVATDGKLKIGNGWATVPTIGIKTGDLVGAEPLDPEVISSMPTVIPLIEKADEKSVKDGITVTRGLYLTASPNAVQIEAQDAGYVLAGNLKLQVGTDEPDKKSIEDRAHRIVEAAKQHWRDTANISCPAKPSLRVLVGDIEFGSNNDIIKFITNAWNDITKGPGKNNEVVKLLGRVDEAASSFDDATKKLAAGITDLAAKAFPTDKDVKSALARLDPHIKVDLPKIELPKIDLPKVDLPKVEVPKVELPKVTLPKVEVPKVKLPKVELPKISVPKVKIHF